MSGNPERRWIKEFEADDDGLLLAMRVGNQAMIVKEPGSYGGRTRQ